MSKIYDKTAAAFKATTIDTKILDAQQILVKPKGGSFDDRVDILDAVGTSLTTDVLGKTGFAYETISTKEATLHNDCEAMRIKSSLLPHGKAIDQIIIPTCGTMTESKYVGVYIIEQNEPFGSSNKIFLGISDNATTWSDGGKAIWNFDKKPFTIPTGYDVELHIARNENDLTSTGTTITNKYISCYYKEVGENQGGVRYASIWYASPGRAIPVIFSEKSVEGKICNTVNEEIVKGLKSRYTKYSNLVFPLATEAGDNVYTSSFRFGYKHCPQGLIKKISLYGRDANSASHDSKTNGCYLIAKVYNKADASLVRQQTSTNKVVVREKQSNETVRPLNTWYFDGIIAPKENEIIKFIPSPDGINQVDAYYLGFFVDKTHTHTDCQTGGDWDYVNDPLRAGDKNLALCEMQGDFYKDIEEKREIEEYEKKFIKSLYTTQVGDVFNNNINNESLGMGSVKAFVIERPYLANGLFSEMKWTSQGNVSSTCRMKITLRDLNGNPVRSLMSSNSLNFSTAGEKIYKFDEFAITDNIGSILCEGSTDGVNVSNSSQFRVAIIGNATKPNADGSEVTNNPFVCHVIFRGKVAQVSDTILTKERADSLYAAKDGIVTTTYDWTPDLQNNIKLEVSSYTIPVNGWLVSRDWQYLAGHDEIRINGLPVGQVNPDGNFSLLVKKDDVLTIGDGNGTATFWFLPCKSEQNDYRVTHTPRDIWRGAVTTDASGNTVVQNMFCPDTTGWQDVFFSVLPGETAPPMPPTAVIDEKVYGGDTFICNMQTSEIVNGNSLMKFVRSLTTWDSDLQRLENGKEMFNDCALESFTADLSSLTNGEKMFRWNNLNKFNQPLPKLENGYGMFYQCDLSEFASDLSSLVNGESMFDGNTLSVFEVDNLDNLQNGTCMFMGSGIENWNIDLHSLTNGECMFYNTPLVSFTGNMHKLTNGQEMFSYNENLSEFRSDLSALTNGSCMFESCWGLKTFDTKLPVLENGERMFNATSIESFDVDELPALQNGNEMFAWIKTKNFTTKMPKLKNGLRMFYWSGIQNFDSDLSSLTEGHQMFNYSKKLTTFTSDLSALTNGYCMFRECRNLKTFDADLSSLTSGHSMFLYCEKLESFSSDLSSLTNGYFMFHICDKLTTFDADLSSLQDGEMMFDYCNLTAQSVENILTTIPSRTNSPKLTMTMSLEGCAKAAEILSLTGGSVIPNRNSFTSGLIVDYKGWKLDLTCLGNLYTVPVITSPTAAYDIVSPKYIPDASSWNSDNHEIANSIVRVINGEAFDV